MNAARPELAPPPWQLQGRGLVALFYCSRAFGNRCAETVPGLEGRAVGGIGALMLVDYAASNVGPYRELLIVPGRFADDAGTPTPAVTHIWVSTQASIDNGRHHWGLPKARASFRDEILGGADSAKRRVSIHQRGHSAVRLTYRPFGPQLPVTTGLLRNRWQTLEQPLDGQRYRTRVSANGRVRAARISEATIPPDADFADIFSQRHLASLAVPRFTMTFPLAELRAGSDTAA